LKIRRKLIVTLDTQRLATHLRSLKQILCQQLYESYLNSRSNSSCQTSAAERKGSYSRIFIFSQCSGGEREHCHKGPAALGARDPRKRAWVSASLPVISPRWPAEGSPVGLHLDSTRTTKQVKKQVLQRAEVIGD